jgi:hypothetical protein
MVWTSSADVLVIAAPSSKGAPPSVGYDYRIYKSTSSGAYNTWSYNSSDQLPNNAGGTTPTWLNSLTKDGVTSTLWVATHQKTSGSWHQQLWYSTNSGSSWQQEQNSFPNDHGCVVVHAQGDTIFAGGWDGLWRRLPGGSWTQVTDIADPSPNASPLANTQESIHRHLWFGVQGIYQDQYLGH